MCSLVYFRFFFELVPFPLNAMSTLKLIELFIIHLRKNESIILLKALKSCVINNILLLNVLFLRSGRGQKASNSDCLNVDIEANNQTLAVDLVVTEETVKG